MVLYCGDDKFMSVLDKIRKMKENGSTLLDLRSNQLTELPKEITQLTNLTTLYLRFNQLTELPKEMTKLTKLTRMDFSGNPLVKPPIEIAAKGIKEIRNYFESLEKAETQKLYEAKLVKVVQGQVGETFLAKKIIDNQYNINRNEATTEATIEYRKSFEDVPVKKQCEIVMPEFKEPLAEDDIFISYSHKDAEWLEKLKIHLKPYQRKYNIMPWDDTKIKPGKLWFEEIQSALNSARITILLVSPNFLASEFIGKHELAPLLERAESMGVTILWVAVSASSFDETKLAKYQCANTPDNPLDGLTTAQQNVEFVKICKKIKAALEG